MSIIHILLVDDHAATREEIAGFIQEHDDLRVTGQAADGNEAVCLARRLRPEVVVMDVVMPEMNGVEATAALQSSDPDIAVLALSNHGGTHLVNALFEAGARGYVRKERAYEDLVPAIRTVAGGRMYRESDGNP